MAILVECGQETQLKQYEKSPKYYIWEKYLLEKVPFIWENGWGIK